jgi:hypothetical protein
MATTAVEQQQQQQRPGAATTSSSTRAETGFYCSTSGTYFSDKESLAEHYKRLVASVQPTQLCGCACAVRRAVRHCCCCCNVPPCARMQQSIWGMRASCNLVLF